jgi:hypothetical protein
MPQCMEPVIRSTDGCSMMLSRTSTLGLVLAASTAIASLGTASAGLAATIQPAAHTSASSAITPAARRRLDAEAALRALAGGLGAKNGVRGVAASANPQTLRAARRFSRAISGPIGRVVKPHLTALKLGHSRTAADSGTRLLAWQTDTKRFVLLAYVKTSSKASVQGRYELTVKGLNATGLRASATDPLTGHAVPVHIIRRSSTVVSLDVQLTDYPRLLILNKVFPIPPVVPGPPTTTPPNPITPSPTPPTPTPPTPTSDIPFAASSPWLTQLPSNTPLDPNSGAIVSNLNNQIQNNYGHAALNTTSYSAPIYTVPANQPKVNLTWNNCQGHSSIESGFAAELQDVPVPTDAASSVGTDADMVIWQPSTDTEWEFWKMAQDPNTGGWSACYGGRIDNVSQNAGIFPFPFGTSASGLPMLAYLIRVNELQSGQINHAIDLNIPTPRNTFSWPANRTDGVDSNPTDPAEGERFRLDPSVDTSTLPPGERMIAVALQKYGAIVTDTSGVVDIQAQDPQPIPGAQAVYDRLFPGNAVHLPDIPWNKMQAVAWNYGKPNGS